MRRFGAVLLLLAVVTGVLLAPAYIRYRRTRGIVPPGVRLAGMDMGSAAQDAITSSLERLFSEPVAVLYAGQRTLLRPQLVKFRVDVNAMLADARRYDNPGHLLQVLAGNTFNRPPAPVEIPLRYTLDQDALDNWLQDIAAHYNRAPSPPLPDPAALTIHPGRPGRQVDVAASRSRILTALTDPGARSVDLVVHEASPPPVTTSLLAQLLEARAGQFPGTVGIFVHFTSTGAEVAVGAGVAYSAMSTMEIAILEEVYRKLNVPPDGTTAGLIADMIGKPGNEPANALLALIGDGDAAAGAAVLNASLRKIGLRDTFMAAPFGQEANGPPIVTEANRLLGTASGAGEAADTRPDPDVQTTPRDMGLMLELLVECSQGGGTLLAAYRDQFTPDECRRALDDMQRNDVTDLIVSGLPSGVRAVHKHGYTAHTHGDVAAIWGPAGPYVISVFLYSPAWLEWELSSRTMGELSTAVWNYSLLANQQ